MLSILDHEGRPWVVFDERPTVHGWPVYLGKRQKPDGSAERAGSATILTPELVAYVRATPSFRVRLPIGANAVKRIRKLLDLPASEDAEREAWWGGHAEELRDTPIEKFAAQHRMSVGAVHRERTRRFGHRLRKANWWRDPAIAERFMSDATLAQLAGEFGISAGSAGRIRCYLRRAEGILVDPQVVRARIAQAKAGKPAHPNTAEALRVAAARPKSRWHARAIGEALKALGVRPVLLNEWTPDELSENSS